MFVAAGAAAVFVMGFRWNNTRRGMEIQDDIVFQWAPMLLRMLLGDARFFIEGDSHMQMSTLPDCTSDHSIKQNELSQIRPGKASNMVFFFICVHNHIFLSFFAYHLSPPCSSLPHTYPRNSPRQKDKLPSGLLF